MGLFNELLHFLNGKSAELSMDLQQASISSPFSLNIKANIKDDSINCRKVYLLVRCTSLKLEEFKPADPENMTDNEHILSEMREWESETIYKEEMEVAGKMQLNAGKEYSWAVDLDLSKAPHPSLKTDTQQIKWELQAGIDVTGNDPDTGWVEIEVAP